MLMWMYGLVKLVLCVLLRPDLHVVKTGDHL